MISRYLALSITRITVRHYSKRRALALYKQAQAEKDPKKKESLMCKYSLELESKESSYDRRHDEILREVKKEQESLDSGFATCIGTIVFVVGFILLAHA